MNEDHSQKLWTTADPRRQIYSAVYCCDPAARFLGFSFAQPPAVNGIMNIPRDEAKRFLVQLEAALRETEAK
jgi:hypothetical protein